MWLALAFVSAGTVTQMGEIVVMEGDPEIVDEMGAGSYSISSTGLDNIVGRFYLHYPDDFDAIAVFTAFPDAANPGAYAICQEKGVTGLGSGGGCPGGSQRLLSVVGSSRVDLQACKLEYSIVSPK